MGWLLQKPKNFGIPALKRLIFWGSFQYRNWKNDVSFRRMCLKIPGPKNDGDKISLSAKLKSSIRTSSTAGGTALCLVDGKNVWFSITEVAWKIAWISTMVITLFEHWVLQKLNNTNNKNNVCGPNMFAMGWIVVMAGTRVHDCDHVSISFHAYRTGGL